MTLPMYDAHMMDVALLHQRALRLVRDQIGEPERGGASVYTKGGLKITLTRNVLSVELATERVYSWMMDEGYPGTSKGLVQFRVELIRSALAQLERIMVLDDLANV